MVVFVQKWLYSGKGVVFGQKLLYSGKVVVFGQNGCIRTNRLVSGKSLCFGAKVVVVGQSGIIRGFSTTYLCSTALSRSGVHQVPVSARCWSV